MKTGWANRKCSWPSARTSTSTYGVAGTVSVNVVGWSTAPPGITRLAPAATIEPPFGPITADWVLAVATPQESRVFALATFAAKDAGDSPSDAAGRVGASPQAATTTRPARASGVMR